MIPIVSARVLQVISAVIMMRVMTTMLSPVDVGAVSIALSISVMLNLVLVNPVWMYMLRNLHEWQRLSLLPKKIFGGFLRYLGVTAVSAPVIIAAIWWLGLGVPGGGWGTVLSVATHFAVYSAVSTMPLLINNLGQTTKAAVLNSGIALLSLGGCVLVGKLFAPGVAAWMLGLSLGYAVVFFIGIPWFVRIIRDGDAPSSIVDTSDWNLGDTAKFALPLAISVFFAWGQLHGYRFVFAGELGAHRLGLFFSGYALGAAVVNTVESILIQYFQPAFYRRVSQNKPSEAVAAWGEYSSKVLPALLLCIFFVAGAAPFMAKLLLGLEFQSASKFAVWGAAVESLRAALAVFSLSAHAQTRTKPLILANIAGAVAALGLTILFVAPFGETGVGFALVLSFVFAIVVVYSRLGRGINMPIKPSTMRDTLVGALFVLGFSVVVNYLLPASLSLLSAVNGILVLTSVFCLVLTQMLGIWPAKVWRALWP